MKHRGLHCLHRLHEGVTIIELMVTLGVAAVLIGFAMPGFVGFVAQQTYTATANDLVGAINVARSEALRRRAIVTLQAVDASDSSDEWGPGWCVTAGDPGDCNTPIRVFEALDDYTLDGGDNFASIDSISFDSRGLLTLGLSGRFDLCHTTQIPGRRITVSPIGRPSIMDFPCP